MRRGFCTNSFLRAGVGALATLGLLAATPVASAQDASAPTILQWFDGSWNSMERRTADVFMAGYGTLWVPPPGIADSGGFSVGYDVYDRFNLGSANNRTLYGTTTGFRSMSDSLHRMGGRLHIDAVINHNGFSDRGTSGDDFLKAGGYPGFLLENPDGGGDPYGVPNTDGDFNSGFDYGDLRGRLAGLIDIDHSTNWRFIRHPVDANDSRNLPAGTDAWNGRLANVANPNNRALYPDLDGPYISVFDPVTGQSDIRIYQFNKNNPMAGDAVEENVTGMLMRYMQWMVQVNGVDGFRLDAAKHIEGFTFDFLDRAVYRANDRLLLDGSTDHVFSYSEVFDGDKNFQQNYIKKTIDPNDIGKVGGNRDVLDFPLHFGLKANLSSNGFGNDWRNLVQSGMDVHDDGLHNGSQGVKFVSSHDDGSPDLGNVAHAYTLLTPGNAIVYYNAKEFGDNRDFPKDGRGDALGGEYGDTITELVNLRNTHGRGDYRERWIEKDYLGFERSGSMLVLLSNRNDSGVSDFKRMDIDLPFGTHLIEMTGNADHDALIPKVITVTNDFFDGPTYVNARFLNNAGQDHGYLVYGLQTPQSDNGVELSNVSQVLAGDRTASNNFENATQRQTDLHVITGDSFDVTLNTKMVNLLGTIRDHSADGDNALLRIDGGLDLNGNGQVDFVNPGSVAYGFESFTDVNNPGYFANFGAGGDGQYMQSIDASQLAEGEHYITVRAFRQRSDGGPAVFSDFKKVIYVDRLAPESAIDSFNPWDGGSLDDRDLIIRSVDKTADSVHVFLDLPENMTEQDILDMVGSGNSAGQIDRDLFKYGFFDLSTGNHVATIVTYEITGNRNVQRITGLGLMTGLGGFGDVNVDGVVNGDDLANTSGALEDLIYSNNTKFNASADLNGDGRVNGADLFGYKVLLNDLNVDPSVQQVYRDVLLRWGNVSRDFGTDQFDIDLIFAMLGDTGGPADLDSSGLVDLTDAALLVREILLTDFGDADLDGNIDRTDLVILSEEYLTGSNDNGWAKADFTGDGLVDDDDLAFIAANWNSSENYRRVLGEVLGIPEPTTALLLLAGLPLVGRRRRS